ncbi:MAG: hypothetical protein EZS28_012321 [Streblomastix strix]|uniref:Uncharacterized protein n=1 Tax=Streblomastix strix TaxID=222440 RepID=A0A5J4WCP1_9EUKA|nr:MAG: hypothetical protein EZS28_012321 [Streblomastix strix]
MYFQLIDILSGDYKVDKVNQGDIDDTEVGSQGDFEIVEDGEMFYFICEDEGISYIYQSSSADMNELERRTGFKPDDDVSTVKYEQLD